MLEQAFCSLDDTLRKGAGCSTKLDFAKSASDSPPVVVGIDVGGRTKGFHAVALSGGRYLGQFASTDTPALASWCVHAVAATVIAVDAPCRWSVHGEGRPAERQLLRRGIRCFFTPASGTAHTPHPTGFYDWMLRGEALYRALKATHPLCVGWPDRRARYCFETFPHAITWHLRGGNADARQKRTQRRDLLRQHGIETENLTSIDRMDAALCALAAHLAACGERLEVFGEARSGLIIVPALRGEQPGVGG